MRELLIMVWETAAEQLEERHSDWAYLKPVFLLESFCCSSFFRAENSYSDLASWAKGLEDQGLNHWWFRFRSSISNSL
ncbi:hypothetical protein CMV_007419 [Castanea mollissima]|uniref:Uncharacterized protein n=1 Tax=Castanea mollissima TaxID=60419 RepID=A0A8J4W0B6_9ROSI|nr:hypothetical protein CMV_007419 [Castanea mollissima]